MKIEVMATHADRESFAAEYARARGLTYSGKHGCYAQAYDVIGDPTRIVKIGRSYDRAYTAYLRECLKNQGNPFFPRIYSAKRVRLLIGNVDYSGKWSEIVVVEMERLRHVNTSAQASDRYYACNKTRYDFSVLAAVPDAEPETVAAAETFGAIMRRLFDRGFSNDTHENNVMVRADGQLVFTDPVS